MNFRSHLSALVFATQGKNLPAAEASGEEADLFKGGAAGPTAPVSLAPPDFHSVPCADMIALHVAILRADVLAPGRRYTRARSKA